MQCNVGYFEISEYFKLFDTFIKPILCYAAEIWGNQYSEIIETVHDKYGRKFLKLPANVAKVFVRGQYGRRPLYIDYYCNCIKYWIKLISMDTYRYPYQSYKMLRNLDEVGRLTWATKVRELLFKFGFGYVWFYENVGNENICIQTFKQRLIATSTQDWSTQLSGSGKARHYRFIMPNLQVAHYLFEI